MMPNKLGKANLDVMWNEQLKAVAQSYETVAVPNLQFTSHAGDCTIFAALFNGTPLDGICTCGYGWECVRRGDWSKMFSEEWLKQNQNQKYPTP